MLPGGYLGHDPRSGAMLLTDESTGMARVYAWRGAAFEATSPRLDTRDTDTTVRAFSDGAWVAHYESISRVVGDTWETHGAEVCGGTEGEPFVFIDAASASEAWAFVTFAPTMELCHFDGVSWTREPIDFLFTQGAVVGDRLLAFHDDIVSERPIEGGAWTEIPLGVVLDFRLVPEGVVVVSSLSPTETLIRASGSGDLLDGTLVGFGADRWSAEALTSSGEDCPVIRVGMLSDCTYTYDWLQIVIGRSDGSQREVAHRTILGEGAGSDASFFVLGPDVLGVQTNDGFFVTP